MITSGKYAGHYIALNGAKVTAVSTHPFLVNQQTFVSCMYLNDIQSVSMVGYGATGDTIAVQNWLTTLRGAGMRTDKTYTIRILWRDGTESIANVTDDQFSAIFASKSTPNPQYAPPKPITPQKPNPPTSNGANDVEKKFFAMFGRFFLLLGIGGAALICLVSWALYGEIYVFDGYEITAVLWILCFLFIAIGLVGVFGSIGKQKISKGMAIAIIGIVILFALVAVGNFFSGCSSGSSSNKDGHLVTGTCSHCYGSGKTSYGSECRWCNGTGYWAYYD